MDVVMFREDRMMKEMISAPPLPLKTRGNSCSTGSNDGAGATVFVRPSSISATQVHSSSSSAHTQSTFSSEHVGAGVGSGHVVKIKINPENGEVKPSATVHTSVSSIHLNQPSEATATVVISSVKLNSSNPEQKPGCVRINVGESVPNVTDDMLQHRAGLINPGDVFGKSAERTNAYFFCGTGLMSSGQCSPSDTLDSGTCSDLDGTPPPLPKKKSSPGVTVTVIGAQHKRASSLTSSGADPDSASGSDNESNISCDSLNSSELNESISVVNPIVQVNGPPAPPSMVGLQRIAITKPTNSASSFLPQGLLKDIRDRSAKLTQSNVKDEVVVEPNEPVKEPVFEVEEIQEIRSLSRSSVLVSEGTYEERQEQQLKKVAAAQISDEIPNRVYTYETDKYYKFHLNEHVNDNSENSVPSLNKQQAEDDETFAGYRDYLLGCNGSSTIRSAKGTVRGVKNRVRAGIATFLQINDATTKSFREKDAGKIVVYSTTMGIVRHTYQQCVKVKQILRTHLVKFEERDVFMSGECQQEIRERMRCDQILIPQVFVDGQHIGDAETIERLNETGELRKILKPYKSADACTTCVACGGYQLLPCPVCNGSKKSVHRNHFTAEFMALKCMNCDEVGLVRCSTCS